MFAHAQKHAGVLNAVTRVNKHTIRRIKLVYLVNWHTLDGIVGPGARLNDCSMKHYIVLNMALFSHAHVTINAEIKLTHACSRGDVPQST